MEISLNVFCLKDESQIEAQEVGITIDLDNCILKEFTFYNIDFICPVKNNEKYCSVASGGGDFVVDKSYSEVKLMISQFKNFTFN